MSPHEVSHLLGSPWLLPHPSPMAAVLSTSHFTERVGSPNTYMRGIIVFSQKGKSSALSKQPVTFQRLSRTQLIPSNRFPLQAITLTLASV